MLFCMLVLVLGLLTGCSNKEPLQPVMQKLQDTDSATISKASANTGGVSEAEPSPLLSTLNKKLKAENKSFIVALAEYITSGPGAPVGKTLYFKDTGNKQLSAHWVPGDPRRNSRTEITWTTDRTEPCADVGPADCFNAIDQAMATWNSTKCAAIPLTKVNDYGYDWGYVQYLKGFGGIAGYWADITHAGWLTGDFFDLLAPGGSAYILGVTFTFIWIQNGVATDIDHNGKSDVAFREVYYNDAFLWGIDSARPLIDVESIVLHESGHCVSLAHFGTAFRTDSNGKLHFSPRAVMNAGYYDLQQQLLPTDLAGFCSVWSSWPMK